MVEQQVVNFGCRLNSFESEQIRHLVRLAGRDDLLVINSCAVTNEAERQVRQKVRQLLRLHPDKSVAVVGCAAELNPSSFTEIPGVSLVLGNAEKLDGAQYLQRGTTAVGAITKSQKQSLNIKDFHAQTQRTRAHVMIQNGCDHDCTFCAITNARGDSRSVPIIELLSHMRRLVAAGTRDIVLSGVDISAYGSDLPDQPTLGDLVAEILLGIPDLPRLRLSSIDCIELDTRFKALLVSESRIMPHLHLSLQAGDDLILKRMKRRHLRAAAVELCAELRAGRPELVFGADLIAGFPTESTEMFARTMDLVQDCGLTYLHVFPFSARDGTPAARIPNQVPHAERKRRAKALRVMGDMQMMNFFQSLMGSTQEILLETPTFGRTPHYAPVRLVEPLNPAQGIVPVRITGRSDKQLWAEPLVRQRGSAA
ncbi:MAG: tRNA (N(6)-L-threonylcarbamoyladenosine(37)-C(2))-methylthiotransferase MtaB [Alphaproteobacteria bacterium]|nr:tRNA (N(6)-L-threonylcarbamoyladenosine(37)-C(2))-methylthiotransferase MtaB [Alphaproteobacteria bacterium]